jgi:hypothetical protein
MEVEVAEVTHKNIEVFFLIIFQYFIEFAILELTVTITAFITLKLLNNE